MSNKNKGLLIIAGVMVFGYCKGIKKAGRIYKGKINELTLKKEFVEILNTIQGEIIRNQDKEIDELRNSEPKKEKKS